MLETVVSLALIVFILGIFSISITSVRLQQTNTNRALAFTFIQSQLEALRPYDFEDLDNRTDGDFIGFAYNLGRQTIQNDGSAISSPQVAFVEATTNTLLNNVSSVALLSASYYDDSLLRANLKLDGSSGGAWEMGLTTRYRDPENYYFYRLTSSRQEFIKVFEGVESSLYSQPGSFSAGNWYLLEINAVGTSFQLRLNSSLQTTVNDSDLIAGSVGTMGRLTTHYIIDDLELQSSYGNITANFDGQDISQIPDEFLQLAPQDLNNWVASLNVQDYNGLSEVKEITATLRWDTGETQDSIQLTTLKQAL